MAERRAEDPDAIPAFLEAARSLMKLGYRGRFTAAVMDRIEAPVLLIHGRRDRLVPLTHAEAAAGKHHEWRLRVLEDVGHVPMLEAPARWLEEVEGFLDEAVEQADAISSAS